MRVLIVVDDPLFRLGVAAPLVGGDRLEFILSGQEMAEPLSGRQIYHGA